MFTKGRVFVMWEMSRVGSWVRYARSGAGALCFVSLAACSDAASYEEAPVGSLEHPIVGGSAAPLERAEFTAFLMYFYGESMRTCGGTFIAEDVVLTAAHCSVDDFDLDEQNTKVVAPVDPSLVLVARRPASLAALEASDVVQVASVYVHPDYDSTTQDNDVAVWKLAQPSPGPVLPIAPAKLTARLDRIGATGTAFGYGVTNTETGETSDTLQRVRVPFVDHDVCQSAYYEATGAAREHFLPEAIITDNMLCAGREGKDTCQGDSGGPLTLKRAGQTYLVGITSWGSGCGQAGLPGVYAKASHYAPWVSDCLSGVCESLSEPTSTCNYGFADCDADASNGCEANTLGASHCGGCGIACDEGQACVYAWELGESSARCATAQPLKPRIECVFDPGDGSGNIALFGYNNQNEDTVFVRRGPQNRFTGVPGADETLSGFPGMEEFRPGRYVNAPITAVGSDPVSWSLVGPDGVSRSVLVDASTPACTEDQLEQEFEQPR